MTDSRLDSRIFGERGRRPEPRPPRRGPDPERRLRRWLVLLLALLLVGGAAVGAWTALRPLIGSVAGLGGEETDYPGPGSGTVEVVVRRGDTGESIATRLRDDGVVRTRTAFLDIATADPQATARIQPGTYRLREQMRAADAFAVLTDPDKRVAKGVTLPEGLWASEVYARLSTATGVPVSAYRSAASDSSAIGLPKAARGKVEGWLFPSTYDFERGLSATTQLRAMVARTRAALRAVGVADEDAHRVLTVASIVEAEVARAEDRGKVARVIVNRLADTGPPAYGLLQMDSTVHYAVGQRGRAGTTDAQRASGSRYNTYRVAGLPPGPIGNPGLASIRAAASPAPGPWLYFVTVDPDSGDTRFATTQAEHDRYAAQFRAWCRDNPGSC